MMSDVNSKAVSLAVGDTVEFVANGVVGIVDLVGNHDDCVEYGVDGAAWYSREELRLLQRATLETLAKALTSFRDPEDSED
jgi:hypothetical protein